MASDRHFPNTMADYRAGKGTEGLDGEVPETETVWALGASETADSQPLKVRKMDYERSLLTVPSFNPPIKTTMDHSHSFPPSQAFLKAAMDLKTEVLQSTWKRKGQSVNDPTVYVGVLGTALMCFKVYLATGNKDDLEKCLDIVDACAAVAQTRRPYVTFLCGQTGIYAIGAAAAKAEGDAKLLNHYLDLFTEIALDSALAVGPEQGGLGIPYELLYGRAGFLWAVLFINKYVGANTIPSRIYMPICDAVLAAGRAGAGQSKSPLMYQWHGTRYWGAAHGLAGIMHVLLHFPLSDEDSNDVKNTLRYMMDNRFLSGNYSSSEGNNKDKLIHWCHGASGIALTLCKAAEVYPEEPEFRQAAIEAGDVVWERGLLRRVGLCHGVSGNAYTFLAIHRLTGGQKHLHRAKMFAGFLHDRALSLISTGEMHGGDHPHSLYEGLAGTVCLWLDVTQPEKSGFPGYEL